MYAVAIMEHINSPKRSLVIVFNENHSPDRHTISIIHIDNNALN